MQNKMFDKSIYIVTWKISVILLRPHCVNIIYLLGWIGKHKVQHTECLKSHLRNSIDEYEHFDTKLSDL